MVGMAGNQTQVSGLQVQYADHYPTTTFFLCVYVCIYTIYVYVMQ